jgi:hypothetical protein
VEGGNLDVPVAAVYVQVLPHVVVDAEIQGLEHVGQDAARVGQILQG